MPFPPSALFPLNVILLEVFSKKSAYIVRTGTDMLTDVALRHLGRAFQIHFLTVSEEQYLLLLLQG